MSELRGLVLVPTKKICLVCNKPLTGKQQKYCSKAHSYYAYTRNLKHEVIAHYGGKCTICGNDNIDVLVLDHIDNNGNEHRDITGGSGYNTYQYLKNNDYPETFKIQVLCANCNLLKEIKRTRPKPHKRKGISTLAWL